MKNKVGVFSIWAKKYSNQWIYYSIASIIVFTLIGLITRIFDFESVWNTMADVLISRGFSEDNLYVTQISSTFIVVSLVSFLSDNGDDVLWENTIQYSLVYPKIFNFISISVYLIWNLVFSTVVLFANDGAMFFIFFNTDIILLFVMTYKMIGAFFSRDGIKMQLVEEYDRKSSLDKEDVLLTLRDKSLQYIDRKEYQLLEENLEFLFDKKKTAYLIEILEYLSAENEDDFWRYVNRFDLSHNDEIRRICMDICKRLIYSHQNISLEQELVMNLYGDEYLHKLVKEFEVRDDEVQVRNFSTFAYLLGGRDFSQLVTEKSITEFREKMVYPIVNEDINIPFSGRLQNNFIPPISLLAEALTANDYYSFEYILSYIEHIREGFSSSLFKAFQKGLDKAVNAYMTEETVPMPDYNVATLFVVPRYLENVRIDFLSEENCAYIKNMISNKDEYILLTDTNVQRLIKMGIEPIVYPKQK